MNFICKSLLFICFLTSFYTSSKALTTSSDSTSDTSDSIRDNSISDSAISDAINRDVEDIYLT